MSLKSLFAAGLVAATLTCLTLPIQADQPPARPSPEQMKVIHDCMAAKGFQMPPPPPQRNDADTTAKDAPPPLPPEGDARPHDGPPLMKMSEEQRKALDGCFADAGLTPPPPPQERR